jgi:3-keto-disaccharide hydrolase
LLAEGIAMRLIASGIVLMLLGGAARADETPAGLTPKEIADGWIKLFDGETTFGWSIDGPAKIENGILIVGGDKLATLKTTSRFGSFEFRVIERATVGNSKIKWETAALPINESSQWTKASGELNGPGVSEMILSVPAGSTVEIRELALHPKEMKSLFNGTDLMGWRQYKGDPKREKSQFTVDSEGLLQLKNGPGDLQTEKQFDDFILQIDCMSNGKNCNSGVFFRCLPEQYQQGYEAQIHNGFKNDDRTKPIDYGTGAIYRRQPARKVVSNDHEWFTMTVLAQANHLATWVNGYQTTDFIDQRPSNENARNGSKTGRGCISLQGHDATTDLSFRNIRIAEWKKVKTSERGK